MRRKRQREGGGGELLAERLMKYIYIYIYYNKNSILLYTPNLLALLRCVISTFLCCSFIMLCSSGSSSDSRYMQSLILSKKPGFLSMYHSRSFLRIVKMVPDSFTTMLHLEGVVSGYMYAKRVW